MNLRKAMMAIAPCMFSLPAAAQITFTGETGAKSDGYTTGGVSFFNNVTGGSMEVANFGIQRGHK